MKKSLLVAVILLQNAFLFSQKKRADNWFFGNNAGVSFATGTPTAISGNAMSTPEGCSTISDTSGIILFYTDGNNVWNKNNVLMPNGTGLLGGNSCTQAALIVPFPGIYNKYYIFTNDEIGGVNGLRYSEVDMNLAGGLGNVTATKNVFVANNLTEKLTVVKDPFSNRYWICVHEWGNNIFRAYPFTTSGLLAPVTSTIGAIHSNAQIQNTYGQMKFNACGSKLALAIGYQNTIELFDFNTNTGIVTNAITLPMTDKVYGVEFSPNSMVLYVSCYDPFMTLLQFDISSGVQLTIQTSQVILSTTPSIYGIQQANDGKIYVCKSFDQFLGMVNNPNTVGTGCNYVDPGVDLDPLSLGIISALGMPCFVQSYFGNGQACPFPTGIQENNLQNNFSVYPNPSAGEFSLTLKENSSVTVYSCTGEMIEQFSDLKKENISLGKSYSSGIYFVKVNSPNGNSTLKIVKE